MGGRVSAAIKLCTCTSYNISFFKLQAGDLHTVISTNASKKNIKEHICRFVKEWDAMRSPKNWIHSENIGHGSKNGFRYCIIIHLLWSFKCRRSEATHVTPVREQGP